jgi:sirohydrochlorin ferrochelatase
MQKETKMFHRLLFSLTFAAGSIAGQSTSSETGVLLLAHGGSGSWNDAVLKLAAKVRATYPTEVAFGMATRRAVQDGVDRLAAVGVKDIVAVPLFVSSHSSVIASTEYLLGLRKDMPVDLKVFANMDHSHGAFASTHKHDSDGTTPVKSLLPVRMTPALNHHRLVEDILVDRAASISNDPENEVVIVVAHGPNPEDDNRKWLADMKLLTTRMKGKTRYQRIDYLTIRDDAPEPIASQAKEEFRKLVSTAKAEGKTALVVPLLMSYGGIEGRLKKRLDGLDYRMPAQGLLPDDRLVEWTLESVRQATK